MKNAKQLREERQSKIDQATALFEKAASEKRATLNAEEKAQHDTLLREIDELAGDITRVEAQERLAAEAAGRTAPLNNHNTTEARDFAKYSVLNVVRSTLPPQHEAYKQLSGIEKEMHQEAVKEGRQHNQEIKGTGIPQMLIAGKRDNTITQPTQPEDGSVLVEKDLRPVLDFLRAQTVLQGLGVTYLPGLVGNVGVPTMTQGATSLWKGEIEPLDKSNQKFSEEELSPNRMGTYAIRSKQFLVQTAPAIEAMLRTDLENSVVQKLEQTAINGSGVGAVPLGLLNNPNVNTIALGANGGAFTRSTMIAMMAKVMNNNIPLTNPGFLMNVDTMAALMNTKLDAGSGLFLMNSMDNLGGYKAGVTTNAPNDLTKGSGTNLSATIFGNWRDLLIAQWGGLDITTDPYTLAKEGQVQIIIQTFMDILAQRAKAFTVVKDIVTA
jgi:HK97 family phage major capsid protein